MLPLGASQADEEGFYLGFGFGPDRYSVHAEDYDDGSLTSASADASSRAFRLFGGYGFNRNLAMEVFVTDLGETTFSGTSSGGSYWCAGPVHSRVSADGIGLAAVGRLPLGESGFSLFARGGIFAWDWSSLIRDSCGPFRDSDSGANPMYGGGISYAFNYITSLQLQWERYTHIIDSHDVDAVTLGLSFNLNY
jgi:OOP family OmpA-OmpF porin